MDQQTVRPRASGDDGFTLIETLIALLVFAVIAAGVITSALTITRMSADNRAREIATNLAAQSTDAARLVGDPFQVRDATTTSTADGRTFTVVRRAVWVSSSGGDRGCTGAANLLYKRITVTVSWGGRLTTTAPVRTDTLLATRSSTVDRSSGAVLVSVFDRDGAPVSGAEVRIVPGSSGSVLTTRPPATDSDGCSYATGVQPGVYTVDVSKPGHVDDFQAPVPTVALSVAAGATVSTEFQYDRAGTYTIAHASNAPAGSTPFLPTDLQTTLLPVVGTDAVSPVLTAAAATTAVAWPTPAGYAAIAGASVTPDGQSRCSAFDPAAWPAGTSGGTALAAGTRERAAAADPGGTAALNEKMGVLTVKASGTGSLVATMTAAPAVAGGNPGCGATTTYSFGSRLVNGTITIALPFGAWTLSATSPGGAAILTSATTLTNAVPATTSASGRTVAVVLDPRARR